MISCAEARGELVAVIRGEVSRETADEVERHLGRCAACAAERDLLRRTMEVVREHVQPESSADARMRLRSALCDEFARDRRKRRFRHAWPAFAVPAALLAGVLAALIAAPGAETPAPRAMADTQRRARAVASAGELGPRSMDAVSRGLAWLAAKQRRDGTWSAGAVSDAETTASVTASALLAFAADGQSPRHGEHRAALSRARRRLAELVATGFSSDPDRKPLYAVALGVRALAATYALDRAEMTADERRAERELLTRAGRQLADFQAKDGGFGYVPKARRPDSSCTLFAVAALDELRDADVLDASGVILRAGRYLDGMRAPDGGIAYAHPGDRRAAPALTAALLALDGEFGPSRGVSAGALSFIEKAVQTGDDALLAWSGAEALARHGRPLAAPVASLLASQREDGAWASADDRRCASAGDAVTTAFGVLALAQVYAR